jgi:hypothetical protein
LQQYQWLIQKPRDHLSSSDQQNITMTISPLRPSLTTKPLNERIFSEEAERCRRLPA